jgi:hypothetical protein
VSTTRRTIAPRVLPAKTPAKARMLAELAEIARQVQALDEGACVLLEQARVLPNFREHVVTLGNVVTAAGRVVGDVQSVIRPTLQAVDALTRAAELFGGTRRRRR